MSESQRSRPRSRLARRLVVIVGGLVVILVLFVAMLPTLISLGLGHGFIRDAIGERVNGDVDFDSVHVSWFGNVGVSGLTITESDGREAVDLTVDVDRSLLDLIRGSLDGTTVGVSGRLDGEVREDGSISFADLMKPSTEPSTDENLPDIDATIEIGEVDIRLHDATSSRDVVFDGLTGRVSYVPGAASSVKLKGIVHSDTPGGVADGSVEISGSVDGLIAGDGALSYKGASVDLRAVVRDVGVPRVPSLDRIEHLDVTVNATDVTDTITTTITMASVLDDGHRSTLDAELTAVRPVSSDGTVQLGPESITGTVTGRSVPTGLAQQFLADTPLVATRDFGETVSVEATFSDGETRDVELSLTPDNTETSANGLTIGLVATIDATTGEVTSNRVDVSGRVHPEVLAAYTPVRADQPVDLQANLTDLHLPAIPEGGSFDLDAVAIAGRVVLGNAAFQLMSDDLVTLGTRIDHLDATFSKLPISAASAEPMWSGAMTTTGRITSLAGSLPEGWSTEGGLDYDVKIPSLSMGRFQAGEPIPLGSIVASGEITIQGPLTAAIPGAESTSHSVDLQYAHITVETPAVAQGVHLAGSATLAGGTVTFDERLEGLVDDAGAFSASTIAPIGMMQIVGVDPALIASFAGDHGDLVQQVATGPVAVRMETSGTAAALQADVEVISGANEITIAASVHPDRIQLNSTQAEVELTPELVAMLQGEAPSVALLEAARVDVVVDPITLNRGEDNSIALRDDVTATVSSTSVNVQATETIGVVAGDFKATVSANREMSRLGVVATTTMREPASRRKVSGVELDLALASRDGAWVPDGSATLRDLNVEATEIMLGQEPGSMSGWTGVSGDVDVSVASVDDELTISVRPDLPRLSGTILAELKEDVINLSSDRLRTTLAADVLEAMLVASPDEGEGDQSPALRVTRDVPVTVDMKDIRIPIALIDGAAFDGAMGRIDLTARAKRVDLQGPDGVATQLADLVIDIEATDFTEPIAFSVKGHAIANEAGSDTPQTPISIVGTLADVMSDASMFEPANGRLEMEATVTDVPTAIADAILNLEGMLVAAVGPQMEATFTALNFSSTTGTLITNIKTTNGWLKGRVRGRDEAIKIVADKPIRAQLELTEQLRDRLLQKIHPIFADIRTVDSPLVLALDNASIPVDGDVSKLSGDFEITVGDLQVDKGSLLVALLSVTRASDSPTITGSIEPIRGQIRDGVVTYDRFALTIDRHSMVYAGEVDLNTRTVNLRTELPLASLAMSVKELRGFGDKIVVPIVTSGHLDAPETKIDPSFNLAEAAARAGFQGVLGNVLGEGGIGGLLDDIFKR